MKKLPLTKLPLTLKLTWHEGYKKNYPKDSYEGAYVVQFQSKKKPHDFGFDFAIFIKETLNGVLPYDENGKPYNWDRWRLLVNSLWPNEIYVKKDIEQSFEVVAWAEIKAEIN